jgi:ribonuclease P protein component
MAINKGLNSDLKSKTPLNTLPPVVFMRPMAKNITILVSKKNFKTAVARNKAKRLIKEAVRIASKDVGIPLDQIYLKINAQKPILDVQFLDLVAIIRKELGRH